MDIPLVTGFRGLAHRETVIIDGPSGPGEWAAFTEYGDAEAAWWLATALEQAFLTHAEEVNDLPSTVPVNAIVPALDATEVGAWLKRFPGVTVAKVKVGEPGQTTEDDLSRVAAVKEALGDGTSIRLDANGAWSVEQTIQMATKLCGVTIDCIEQPVATIEDMRAVKLPLNELGIRLAADEILRKTHQVDALLTGDICDVVIVKPSPLGGYSRSRAIAEKALDAGLDVVVSSAVETSVGLSHAASLAARVNGLTTVPTAHGLATAVLLEGDVVTDPLVPEAGVVRVGPVTLDPGSLQGFAAQSDRQEWWRERLERVLPLALKLL